MTWNIEIDPAAERELRKLDRQVARRLVQFLFERVANLDNPRSIGEALKGSRLGDFWSTELEIIELSPALKTRP